MAIKRIPIKGISRDPSGQISAEGMCAESLNVQLDMGEVAPTIKPDSVGRKFGIGTGANVELLYIHKGIGYENLIGYDTSTKKIHYFPNVDYEIEAGVVDSVLTGDIISITSVGNTLVVSTTDSMYYVLWKNSTYNFLGNQIPIPIISFRTGDLAGLRVNPIPPDYSIADEDHAAAYGVWGEDMPEFPREEADQKTEYGSVANKYAFEKGTKADDFFVGFLDVIWGKIDGLIKTARDNGKAIFPIFIRYAVRLYDGTIYAQSIPVLIGAEAARYISEISATFVQEDEYIDPTQPASATNQKISSMLFGVGTFDVANSYSVYMKMNNGTDDLFEGWEDIVTGVDIFISPQIMPIQRNAASMTVQYLGTLGELEEDEAVPSGWEFSEWTSRIHTYLYNIRGKIDPYYSEEKHQELLKHYQSTFLVKSYSLEEIGNISGSEVKLDDINFSADYIMNQEALVESKRSMHRLMSGKLFNQNNRLLVSGAKQYMYDGYKYLPSAIWNTSNNTTYTFVYFIRGNGPSDDSVVFRTATTGQVAEILSGIQTDYYAHLGPWVAYPDSRCYKVIIKRTSSGTEKIVILDMAPLDQLDVAYAFAGFGKSFAFNSVSSHPIPPTQNRTLALLDTILVSPSNNPFFFPTDKQITLPVRNILSIAVATTPLSEGQFGQFPLYVFTDEGVFSIGVNSQGEYMGVHPVSRDIPYSGDSIVAIEQAIFFASARGLLLLKGRNVTKVSELMDGRPDAMNEQLAEHISQEYLDGITFDEETPFYQFLNGCKMAYDFANSRILIYRTDRSDMYVYKFDTQSWHRMIWNPDSTPVRTLNSYPEAYIVEEGANGKQVPMNYSTIAEDSDAVPLPGLVYTRELSLDEADLYKTINRLKIRGRYADGHVKWALQGSNDGINYRTLHSLRGPSWKWYRIAIVTLLDAQERISYIELDYTPKFANRLR